MDCDILFAFTILVSSYDYIIAIIVCCVLATGELELEILSDD